MTARILAHRHRLVTDENSKWWTLGAMCFALFMIMLDNTVVNVALPSIQKDLGASISGLEAFASTLSAVERRKLDAAVEALLDRKEIAAAYEQLKKVRP